MPTFQKHPGTRFTTDDVTSFLETIAAKGWNVYSGNKTNQFIIEFDEDSILTLEPTHDKIKGWRLDCTKAGSIQAIEWAANLPILKEHMSALARKLGYQIDAGPKRIRTRAETPLSNIQGVVTLTHGMKVESIFDPYFEDKTISYLVSMVNLGLKLNSDVRVLTSKKKKNSLTRNVVKAFKEQTGTKLEIRAIDEGHRRFLLLSGGTSLVLGWSANSWTKDEAAHVEVNIEDVALFNEHWTKAEMLDALSL